jgi:hypothetical protein
MLTLASNKSPAPPSAAELKPILDLLSLLADPAATQKRISEFAAAAVEARALLDQAKAEEDKLAAAQKSHDADLQAARRQHDEALRADRSAANEEHQRTRAELDERTRAVEAREAAAAADGARAAELKADLERRLAIISKAAA